jgi:hypothetical protein
MTRYDDDDDFDENGVLRDGRSIHVPLMMCDSIQREVARHGLATRLHDGRGGPVGHRPSFVYSTDASLNDAREEAYRLYDQEMGERWRHGDAGGEFHSQREQGSNPRELPLKRFTGDARTDAYLSREEYDTNAWRGPRSSGQW